MFLAFDMSSAASGIGLCHINRVLLRVTKSRVNKLGSPCTTKIHTDYFTFSIFIVIGIFSSCKDFPIFDK